MTARLPDDLLERQTPADDSEDIEALSTAVIPDAGVRTRLVVLARCGA